jgi:hypothetical protein
MVPRVKIGYTCHGVGDRDDALGVQLEIEMEKKGDIEERE